MDEGRGVGPAERKSSAAESRGLRGESLEAREDKREASEN
jgi:hypothetical protein